jgi:hypothetical protein
VREVPLDWTAVTEVADVRATSAAHVLKDLGFPE